MSSRYDGEFISISMSMQRKKFNFRFKFLQSLFTTSFFPPKYLTGLAFSSVNQLDLGFGSGLSIYGTL